MPSLQQGGTLTFAAKGNELRPLFFSLGCRYVKYWFVVRLFLLGVPRAHKHTRVQEEAV